MSSGYKVYNQLIGTVFSRVERCNNDDDTINFYIGDDSEPKYKLKHEQDCCEHVYIESITGNLSDLVGQPITMAEIVWKDGESKKDEYGYSDESSTWTFIKFATIKGYVDIRFYGSSNGYYSESAQIYHKRDGDGWYMSLILMDSEDY